MRIWEEAIRQLPKEAGKAQIGWTAECIEPRRDGAIIELPLRERSVFLPIQEGQQFVFVKNRQEIRDGIWFGGTDEEPFLVRLETTVEIIESVQDIARDGNEEQFYNTLRPTALNQLEPIFGEAKRQGDIFALPICQNFGALDKWLLLLELAANIKMTSTYTEEKGETPIHGTRHVLEGEWMQIRSESYSSEGLIIGQGTLQAPDHASLGLRRPHALFQSDVLYEPQQAD